MKLTYNKAEKLKCKKTIDQLFFEGKSISAHPLQLIYTVEDHKRKVGVSVSKRKFKKAVHRIRIKRLLREAYRLNKSFLKDNKLEYYTFMILYIGKEMPDYKTIDLKMKVLFEKLIKKTNAK